MSLTDITVCRPWRSTPDRQAGHDRAFAWWAAHDYAVVEADSDPSLPFLCGQARNNAIRKATTEMVIIADADTVPDNPHQIGIAVSLVQNGDADVVFPYRSFVHIPESAALMDDYKQAAIEKRYWNSPGGIWITTKRFLDIVGWFDERFIPGELSFDDTSFTYACETLGTVMRVDGCVWSFDHASDANGRPLRDYSPTNRNWPRFQLYVAARNQPELMRKLVKHD